MVVFCKAGCMYMTSSSLPFCFENPILIEYKPSASERMLIYRIP
ncbi:hypothetical protein SAMN05660706_1405 [Desulfoscipio geothermicus DSM 3669]|uniref:Uncharacterized protein n=1 Tax=Desulfoscipio geothermicus DSM 3669 TaxID=1121426 RepID=A0A1I6EFI4_9FIRM|nr:hypothetical protein SAMN05660706_1405 [Desulfoscipio geothermicus DSM 3669]